ncbi:MAG: thiamine pyrophosphate-dependent dehydrogenase E1 component subunit alpha [Anaerolineales bacterium]
MDNQTLYHKLFLIRYFEETVLNHFSKGYFPGTTHTYLGQEANAVGVLSHISPNDIVFSNHRCHGHFLAYGGDPRQLFAELMGRVTGVCGGRGGSQHLHWKNFYSNGIQGGIVPIATGMALAEKRKGNAAIAIAFLGDGTLGEGVIYEAFNLASKWQAPILYVLENNHIAQTTPINLSIAGAISARFSAFDIPYCELDTSDVQVISSMAKKWLHYVRETESPAALILHTYRFGPHSKGDDTRPADFITQIRSQFDPIQIHGARLNPDERMKIEEIVKDNIQNAFLNALNDPFPEVSTTW